MVGVGGADGTCVAHTHLHMRCSVCEWGGGPRIWQKRRHKVGPAWHRGRGAECRGLQMEDPARLGVVGTEVQAEQYAAGCSGGWAGGPEGAHLGLAQVLALPLAR